MFFLSFFQPARAPFFVSRSAAEESLGPLDGLSRGSGSRRARGALESGALSGRGEVRLSGRRRRRAREGGGARAPARWMHRRASPSAPRMAHMLERKTDRAGDVAALRTEGAGAPWRLAPSAHQLRSPAGCSSAARLNAPCTAHGAACGVWRARRAAMRAPSTRQ